MIEIGLTKVTGFEDAIRGMRNPMDSWGKSDSDFSRPLEEAIGKNDLELAKKLAFAGSVHGKYRRMVAVYTDILAPLYWWKEYDTYKVGTVANSCSTMHKIHSKEFKLDDFSHEHLPDDEKDIVEAGGYTAFPPIMGLKSTINTLNVCRAMYLHTKDKTWWWKMIQILPSSYNQKRTVMANYEVLAAMYASRKNHKLDEWHKFCEWVETLPYSELITISSESAVKGGGQDG